MNKNPYSAIYFIKENRGKACLGIIMMFLASFLLIGGNYIHSTESSFDEEYEISDKLVIVGLQSTDENYEDFKAFKEKVKKDDKLSYVDATALGFSGLQHNTVIEIPMGGWSYVFNSREDMEKIFTHLGIKGDFSDCGNNTIVISDEFAKNLGVKKGDIIDHSFDSSIDGTYTVGAVTNGGGYVVYYICESAAESLGRLYIYSDSMLGDELYNYVNDLAEGLKVKVSEPERKILKSQFEVFFLLFYAIDIIIAIVLAVTINSVITGHYINRTYEFGVYRAIGISKSEIKKKVAKEILIMNAIAMVAGLFVNVMLTYILNELIYMPKGINLKYFTTTGVIGLLICDALIVIPLIITKGRMMSKSNITEF